MDDGTVFHQINAKLGGAIMKPKNLKYKFLPIGIWFFLIGEHRTSDWQSRYVAVADQKKVSLISVGLKKWHEEKICFINKLYRNKQKST